MKTYVVFLRGINVGGKNKIPMKDLKECIEGLGFKDVSTYIASGNVMLRSNKSAERIEKEIEKKLPKHFKLDRELVKVLVLSAAQLCSTIAKKPKGFGNDPQKYHYDVVFLIDITAAQAMSVFQPKEGVDTVWKGRGVIYHRRLSSALTKSRMSKISGTPAYQHMTIRNWNTVTKLCDLVG